LRSLRARLGTAHRARRATAAEQETGERRPLSEPWPEGARSEAQPSVVNRSDPPFSFTCRCRFEGVPVAHRARASCAATLLCPRVHPRRVPYTGKRHALRGSSAVRAQ
jgi:hypothetical protein